MTPLTWRLATAGERWVDRARSGAGAECTESDDPARKVAQKCALVAAT